jgi:chitinase
MLIISRTDSKYYQILKRLHADLDFIMPQFYNDVTRPTTDGVNRSGAGSMRAQSIFNNLANDMSMSKQHKVVFGFCISDCSGTGSNVRTTNQAVKMMTNLKAFTHAMSTILVVHGQMSYGTLLLDVLAIKNEIDSVGIGF